MIQYEKIKNTLRISFSIQRIPRPEKRLFSMAENRIITRMPDHGNPHFLFEQRNIHFHVNKFRFRIVEFSVKPTGISRMK